MKFVIAALVAAAAAAAALRGASGHRGALTGTGAGGVTGAGTGAGAGPPSPNKEDSDSGKEEMAVLLQPLLKSLGSTPVLILSPDPSGFSRLKIYDEFKHHADSLENNVNTITQNNESVFVDEVVTKTKKNGRSHKGKLSLKARRKDATNKINKLKLKPSQRNVKQTKKDDSNNAGDPLDNNASDTVAQLRYMNVNNVQNHSGDTNERYRSEKNKESTTVKDNSDIIVNSYEIDDAKYGERKPLNFFQKTNSSSVQYSSNTDSDQGYNSDERIESKSIPSKSSNFDKNRSAKGKDNVSHKSDSTENNVLNKGKVITELVYSYEKDGRERENDSRKEQDGYKTSDNARNNSERQIKRNKMYRLLKRVNSVRDKTNQMVDSDSENDSHHIDNLHKNEYSKEREESTQGYEGNDRDIARKADLQHNSREIKHVSKNTFNKIFNSRANLLEQDVKISKKVSSEENNLHKTSKHSKKQRIIPHQENDPIDRTVSDPRILYNNLSDDDDETSYSVNTDSFKLRQESSTAEYDGSKVHDKSVDGLVQVVNVGGRSGKGEVTSPCDVIGEENSQSHKTYKLFFKFNK